MKKLFSIIPLLFIFGIIQGQIYNIDDVDGLTVSTCSGDFDDDGEHAHNC